MSMTATQGRATLTRPLGGTVAIVTASMGEKICEMVAFAGDVLAIDGGRIAR